MNWGDPAIKQEVCSTKKGTPFKNPKNCQSFTWLKKDSFQSVTKELSFIETNSKLNLIKARIIKEL